MIFHVQYFLCPIFIRHAYNQQHTHLSQSYLRRGARYLPGICPALCSRHRLHDCPPARRQISLWRQPRLLLNIKHKARTANAMRAFIYSLRQTRCKYWKTSFYLFSNIKLAESASDELLSFLYVKLAASTGRRGRIVFDAAKAYLARTSSKSKQF